MFNRKVENTLNDSQLLNKKFELKDTSSSQQIIVQMFEKK